LAAELRWILLALSVPMLVAIWWWTARRSRQAPGDAKLRESTGPPGRGYGSIDHQTAFHESPALEAAPMEHRAVEADPRDFGVPPLEPLSIRTADFEQVQAMDPPMTTEVDPVDPALNSRDEREAAADMTPAQAPTVSETQRIVTVRVCAENESHWSGAQLKAALENHGLAFGRYKVFHRKHSDGRTLFCAASLVEPGTFDIARMPTDEFRGLTLFAVLPGPADALQTIDALIATAADLGETLHGTVQDSKGVPLSAESIEALREDVARFQALLTMT